MNMQTLMKRNNRKKARKNKKKTSKKRTFPKVPIDIEEHPWVVRIMSMNSVACTGTVVHPHYVLTSADCVYNSTGLYILPPSIQPVSLYKVWTQHQYSLLQTHTALLTSSICLARRGGWKELAYEGMEGMLLGYKRNSKEEDSMFYSDVIINEAADEAPDTVLKLSDLHKWVNES